MSNENPILFKDLAELKASDEFLIMAKKNGFRNLSDITAFPISEIKQKPGMNYRMLAELGELLKENGLMGVVNED